MSVEAEMAIIGGLIACYQETKYVFDRLPAEFIQEGSLKKAYQLIESMKADNIPVDFVTVSSRLEKGRTIVQKCVEAFTSVALFPEYIRLIVDDYQKDKIGSDLYDIAGRITPQMQASELIETLSKLVDENKELAKQNQSESGIGYITAVEKFAKFLYSEKVVSFTTGYGAINEALGGLLPGTVNVIAGRPGEGKTALAVNIALKTAKAGNKVQYFTMEMLAEQIMQRVASMLTNISADRIRDLKLSEQEKQTIISLLTQISNGNDLINFVDVPVSLNDLRRHVDLFRPHVVIIDHLGLMKVNGKKSRYEAIGELSRGIKQLALEKKFAVVELVQMNRESDKRTNKTPMLSDLRDSGDIEQDADSVMFMTTDRKEGHIVKGDGWLDSILYIRKSRNGRTGQVNLNWQPQYHKITGINQELI